MKTITNAELKRELKKSMKELRAMYDDLDILMDETEIAAEAMTEKEVETGKADRLNKIANIIQSARDYVQLAYDDLEGINM